jgi:2'-5' RNA ligase
MNKYFIGIQPEKRNRQKLKTTHNPEDSHITLQYLGALDQAALKRTRKLLKQIAHRNRDFELTYNNKQPDIKGNQIASNLFRTKRLMRLQQDIHSTLDNKPGYYDKLFYSPHINTGKKVTNINVRPSEVVDKFYLFKVTNSNPRYKKIEGYHLKNRNIFQRVKDKLFGDYED